MLSFLLENQAQPNPQSNPVFIFFIYSVNSPIIIAAKRGLVDCVRLLLQAGVSTSIQDASGRSPLHLACWHGHAAMIPLLLEYKFDVDLQDFEGNTPLHYACWNGNLDICSALLKAGATVDIPDQAGRTPLYFSVQHKHPDIVKFLLENHSDPTIQTCTGVTPESLATQENIDAIVEIFQKFNKESHDQNQDNLNNDTNSAENNGGNNSSVNLLGKDFTDEHNRMKTVINKLIEGRDEEIDMLQKLHAGLDEHNSAISAVQSNIKETMNQLKEIEHTLRRIIFTVNTVSGSSETSSATSNSISSFVITRQNMPQMPASTNGTAFPPGYSPNLGFSSFNNPNGLGIGSTSPNVGVSPLLIPQNERKSYNAELPKTHYDDQHMANPHSDSKICCMCGVNPATVRCKNCRAPFCENCVSIARAKGCPNCLRIAAAKASKTEKS